MDGERKLVRVSDVRTVEGGGVEGLCEYEDGTSEWRPPDVASVEIVNDRTGESADVTDVKIGGASCG